MKRSSGSEGFRKNRAGEEGESGPESEAGDRSGRSPVGELFAGWKASPSQLALEGCWRGRVVAARPVWSGGSQGRGRPFTRSPVPLSPSSRRSCFPLSSPFSRIQVSLSLASESRGPHLLVWRLCSSLAASSLWPPFSPPPKPSSTCFFFTLLPSSSLFLRASPLCSRPRWFIGRLSPRLLDPSARHMHRPLD